MRSSLPAIAALALGVVPAYASAQFDDVAGHDAPSDSNVDSHRADPVSAMAMLGVLVLQGVYAVELAGGLAGAGACADSATERCGLEWFVATEVLTEAVALPVVPLVLWAIGNAHGGSGAYGWSFLGHLIGSLPWAFVPWVAESTGDVWAPSVLSLVARVSGLAGAVIAYAASSDAAPAPEVSVGVTSREGGAVVTLAGAI